MSSLREQAQEALAKRREYAEKERERNEAARRARIRSTLNIAQTDEVIETFDGTLVVDDLEFGVIQFSKDDHPEVALVGLCDDCGWRIYMPIRTLAVLGEVLETAKSGSLIFPPDGPYFMHLVPGAIDPEGKEVTVYPPNHQTMADTEIAWARPSGWQQKSKTSTERLAEAIQDMIAEAIWRNQMSLAYSDVDS